MSDQIVRPKSVPVPATAADAALAAASEVEERVYEFLAFTLADEHYALPLSNVREILKMPPVTEVPRAGKHVLGIISVRGRVTTVLDLRRRLTMPESPLTKQTRILLVDDGEEVLGLLVDSVLSVYRLREHEVEIAAAAGGDTADYVFGIGRPTTQRGAGRAGMRAVDRGLDTADDILILLDPKPLLKR